MSLPSYWFRKHHSDTLRAPHHYDFQLTLSVTCLRYLTCCLRPDRFSAELTQYLSPFTIRPHIPQGITRKLFHKHFHTEFAAYRRGGKGGGASWQSRYLFTQQPMEDPCWSRWIFPKMWPLQRTHAGAGEKEEGEAGGTVRSRQ